MKKLAFALVCVLALVAGCKDRLIFLPVPFTFVGSWTLQDEAGAFYEDTVVYAADLGQDANAEVSLGADDTLLNIFIESVTYTITGNRVPGSTVTCHLRFRRNSGPTATLVGVTDADLDAVVDSTIPLVPDQAAIDTLRDFLLDAMHGSQDTLTVWVEGNTVPDTLDFDVRFTITFTLLKAVQLKIVEP